MYAVGMLNTSLTSYISNALEKGLPVDVVRRNLIDAGWNKADVEAALRCPQSDSPVPETLTASAMVGAKISAWRPISIGLAAVALGILAGEASFSLAQKQVAVTDTPEVAVAAKPTASPMMLLSGVGVSSEPVDAIANDLADVPAPIVKPVAKVGIKSLVTAAPTASPSITSPSAVPSQSAKPSVSPTPSATPSAKPSPTGIVPIIPPKP